MAFLGQGKTLYQQDLSDLLTALAVAKTCLYRIAERPAYKATESAEDASTALARIRELETRIAS